MTDTINIEDGSTPPRAAKKRPPRDERAPKRTARDATSPGAGDSGGTGSGTPSRPRRRSKDDALLKESLTGMYGMIGAGIGGVGQVQGNAGLIAAGVNVSIQADTLADQWLALADQVPAVRKALEGMLKGGAVSVVVMGNVGIALPVLAAAGILPQQVGNMFLADEAIQAAQAYQAMQAAAAQQNGSAPQ